jgi:hypothetical protein
MGWPIRNTAVYQLCSAYWEFIISAQKQERIYFRDFNKFIDQPAIRFISESWRNILQEELIKKRLTYFQFSKLQEIASEPRFNSLSTFLSYFDVQSLNAQTALEKMMLLLQSIATNPESDEITVESAFQLKEKLQKTTTDIHLADSHAAIERFIIIRNSVSTFNRKRANHF